MRQNLGRGVVYEAGTIERTRTDRDMIRPRVTASHWQRRVPARTAAALVCLLLILAPRPARAQQQEERQPEPTRVYVGMWTTHLRELTRGLDSNHLWGVVYRGFYGGTFINSFGDRAVTAGIQRVLVPRSWTDGLALGYRAGLITGYDERFLPIAGWAPIIPFAQLIGSLDRGRLGVELAYAGVVASVATSIRL